MSRKVIGWIAAFILAIGGAAFAWVWFAGGSGEPSTELTTPTIPGAGPTTSSGDTSHGSTTEPTTARAFVIDSERSIASFEIDEQLRGSPNHVVGETNQVAGQVLVDLDDLSTAQFSQIVINARTFTTGSGQRDRAIRGPIILNSARDEFEFFVFDITSVDDLEGAVVPGETIQFSVTGELTIKATTTEVTFEIQVTLVDDSTIEGLATTQVLRSDFGIGIPSVPGVANVADEVTLNLSFVAVAG